MGWRPRTPWPGSTASATSQCWRRAGSAAATPHGTPRWCARTYLLPESAALYDHAVRLWEGLSAELNYNVMFSQRGLLHLAHSEHDLHEVGRRIHAIHMHGVDSEFLTPAQVREWVPFINLHCRFPVLGALLQRRGGTARHDAVAWGFARAADARGVDIIQNCEVTGFRIEGGTVKGVETAKGRIEAETVGVVVAGHSGVLAERAGFRLPVESVPLQALVSEPLKPVMDCVVSLQHDPRLSQPVGQGRAGHRRRFGSPCVLQPARRVPRSRQHALGDRGARSNLLAREYDAAVFAARGADTGPGPRRGERRSSATTSWASCRVRRTRPCRTRARAPPTAPSSWPVRSRKAAGARGPVSGSLGSTCRPSRRLSKRREAPVPAGCVRSGSFLPTNRSGTEGRGTSTSSRTIPRRRTCISPNARDFARSNTSSATRPPAWERTRATSNMNALGILSELRGDAIPRGRNDDLPATVHWLDLRCGGWSRPGRLLHASAQDPHAPLA